MGISIDTTRHIAGVMYTNMEQISDIGCPIPDPSDDESAPAAVESECSLGNMPSYVVNVTTTEQVVESVKFAAKHNLRLRIKNVRMHCVTLNSTCGRWTYHGFYALERSRL